MRTCLPELALQASVTLGDEHWRTSGRVAEARGAGQGMPHALLRWSMADPRPLVLLIDEVDALVATPSWR